MNIDDYRAVLPEAASSLIELIGDAVLLGCEGKKPLRKRWQTLTPADMTSSYLASLRGKNIGLVLGSSCGGLCSIDFDEDSLADEFLRLNPVLATSLQTRGARGRNIWLRIEGTFPDTTRFCDRAGRPAGEWRSNRSQTIIYGIHPTTKQPYTVLNRATPLRVRFLDIQWPSCLKIRWPANARDGERKDLKDESPSSRPSRLLHGSSLSLASPSLPSSPLSPSDSTEKGLQALRAAVSYSSADPARAKLFNRLTRPFKPEPHARNRFITQAVPFIFRAVSESLVVEFSLQFYDVNAALFQDPRDQHQSETLAMLESVRQTYLESLSSIERKYYDLLPDEELCAAFRICRDLSAWDGDPECPPPLFFLALGELGTRIGRSTPRAQKVMEDLLRFRIIEVVQRGTQYVSGSKGRATRYRFCLTNSD